MAIIVWERQQGSDPKTPESWREAWKMKDAHPATINYLTSYKGNNNDDLYFTTMCSSGVLKLWVGSYDENDQLTFTLKSELLFGRNL